MLIPRRKKRHQDHEHDERCTAQHCNHKTRHHVGDRSCFQNIAVVAPVPILSVAGSKSSYQFLEESADWVARGLEVQLDGIRVLPSRPQLHNFVEHQHIFTCSY